MSGIKDQKNMDDLRKRLYERDFQGATGTREKLSSTPIDVTRGWNLPKSGINDGKVKPTSPVIQSESELGLQAETVLASPEPEPPKSGRSYRMIIILASIGFFVLAALVSSIYLFFGSNQISTRNISIDIEAPTAIAAGENLMMQLSVANQNAVPINSAVLIINYPPGTKSSDGTQDLYEERISLDSIESGEAVNVPIQVLLFGEEGEEKEIRAVVEYRVQNSNGTFFKDADPIKIKINSSPIAITVDSLGNVSSGQEIEVKVTVNSNSPVPQKNILLAATYPDSFSYVSADIDPSYGQNEWLIPELSLGQPYELTIRGKINGAAKEEAEIQFSAGTPRSDNQFIMGSVITKTQTRYVIENSFLKVEAVINGDNDGSAVIEAGETARAVIRVTNTIGEILHDVRVVAEPTGNLIRDGLVSVQSGSYDSGSKTILWDKNDLSSLKEVAPEATRELIFNVSPDVNQATAAFDFTATVYARVGSEDAGEVVVGTVQAKAVFSSEIEVKAEVGYRSGAFEDRGEIPPVVGKETTYTVTLKAEAGANDLTNSVLTASLPDYITWLNNYQGEGTVTYDPAMRQIKWNVGPIQAQNQKELQVQISFVPLSSHIGTTPNLVGTQELRATDRFTEASLRDQNSPITTQLPSGAGFSRDNGEVEAD